MRKTKKGVSTLKDGELHGSGHRLFGSTVIGYPAGPMWSIFIPMRATEVQTAEGVPEEPQQEAMSILFPSCEDNPG